MVDQYYYRLERVDTIRLAGEPRAVLKRVMYLQHAYEERPERTVWTSVDDPNDEYSLASTLEADDHDWSAHALFTSLDSVNQLLDTYPHAPCPNAAAAPELTAEGRRAAVRSR